MSARKSLAPSSDGTPRVLVVYKKSAWQTHVKERKNARYIALLKQGNVVTQRLEEAHRQHQATLEETKLALDALGVRSVFRFRGDEGLVEGFDLMLTQHDVGPPHRRIGERSQKPLGGGEDLGGL